MKNILRAFAFITVFGLAFSLAACNKTTKKNATTENKTTVESKTDQKQDITVSFEQESVEMNEWETVTVNVSSSDGSPVALEVNDKTKLYIKGNKITGLAAGTVTLTAISTVNPEVKATMTVIIKEKAENRPELNIACDGVMYVSEVSSLRPTLKGVEEGTYTVDFEIADNTVASIDENGSITALKIGSTTVKATTKYRSVTFECTVTINVGVRVIFLPEETKATLTSSTVAALADATTIVVNGKTLNVTNGVVELDIADFNLEETSVYDATVGDYNFKLIVYAFEGAKVFQDGVEIEKGADGYRVDTTKTPDANGLHWITFDASAERVAAGYQILEVTFKYEDITAQASAGIVAGTLGEHGYEYLFGYKYGNDTWVYFDNNYLDQPSGLTLGYFAAIRVSAGAPYDYGYVRLYDKETGDLLIDYYHLEITDGSGTHGNWSGYTEHLLAGKEYVLELDAAKMGDITMSGFDKAIITNVEWKMKAETEISYENENVTIDCFDSIDVMPKINDDSEITLEYSDESLFYIVGTKAYAVKAGTCVITATANGKTATMTVTVNANEAKVPTVDFTLPVTELEVGRTLDLTAKLMSNGVAMNKSLYDIEFITSSTGISIQGSTLKGLTAGEAKVTCVITLFDMEYTEEVTLTIKEQEIQEDPSVARLYQAGAEIKPNAEGKYLVDTTKDGDASTRRWVSFDTEKLESYNYLRMNVKFNSWFNIKAGCVTPSVNIYNYHWGYNYSNVQFFWDNEYKDGGFGGACGPDGSANRDIYMAIYNADGTPVLDCLTGNGWTSNTSYATLELGKEYILIFNVAAMGEDFRIAGFDGAEISNVKWQETADLGITPIDPIDPPTPIDPVDPVDPSIAHLYQGETELTPNEEGEYTVDTTKDGDASTRRWISFDTDKLSTYKYLRMNVKFNSWFNIDAGCVAPGVNIYNYHWGYNYSNVQFFWDNAYSGGGFGGACGPDGDANRDIYMAIYNADGTPVLDCLTGNGWTSNTSYATLELGKEYIFLFNVKAMGNDFKIAGFDGATISNVKWLKTTNLNPEDEPEEEPIDLNDPIANLYQNDKKMTTNEEGKYVVDTTKDADSNGLRWVTFDTDKLANFNYLRMTVKFSAWTDRDASCASTTCSQYKYSFGWKYADVKFFWDNVSYPDGGFGGACGPDGSADRDIHMAIYDADGNVVLDCLTTKGWTSNAKYATLELNKEYIFLFNVKAMGADFKIAGFDGAEISNVKWLESSDLELDKELTHPQAHLYQNGVEIKATTTGKYLVDIEADADSDGLRWLTVDTEKTANFKYLKMTVKFSEWCSATAARAGGSCDQYRYCFGFDYGNAKFFFDNTYSGGGFGGACSAGGNANMKDYFAIYNTDGTLVLDAMNTSGWTNYATLELDKEYVFVFDVQSMGETFKLAGFDDAEILNIAWTNEI